MEPMFVRVAVAIAGIIFMCITAGSYIQKNLSERFTWLWMMFDCLLLLSTLVPGAYNWVTKLNVLALIFFGFMAFLIVLYVFLITKELAFLRNRNTELAMHVSLLNQENERILSQLEQLTGRNKQDL